MTEGKLLVAKTHQPDEIEQLIKELQDPTPTHITFLRPYTHVKGYAKLGLQLARAIDAHNDVVGYVPSSIASEMLPAFVACRRREIMHDAEITYEPVALFGETAVKNLHEYIAKNFLTDSYMTANFYDQMSADLYVASMEMQGLDAERIIFLAERTKIPERVYEQGKTNSVEIELNDALNWDIVTRIIR